ncbi:MAG: nucleotidyltransferase family protein [Candidatus Electrothrix aestuarii]|uniref:Nucleotidyltransferase family protein n=1 Tax=Candidatus Electrothrix aestuarii TaxID=3062594 RepID=A0AAU8LW35_9BACT|nr:nucleotidyltransferase family protein [Candidatus Electrothrix aestuarii]
MIQAILALCARDLSHATMLTQLDQSLAAFQRHGGSWSQLIREAERQGVAPLLYKHTRLLNYAIPVNERRMLQGLYLRNRHSNRIRNKAVQEILHLCSQQGTPLLLVKGIALANFAYDEIGLRPMRDIDLLIHKDDIGKVKDILYQLGYRPDEKHAVPDDYYHLTPMNKNIDGLPVSMEVHHNLLPFHPQYPLWPLEKSYNTAWEFKINGITARTLNLEDTLWYVYLHGFRAPLTYEPFRLVHVADLVTLVEKFSDKIDWQSPSKEMRILGNALSCLHHLTPWPQHIREEVKLNIPDRPQRVGFPYEGWPLRKIQKTPWAKLPQLARKTLWPSQWWVQLYYGHMQGRGYWKARCIDHPRMLWRWIKAYWHAHRTALLPTETEIPQSRSKGISRAE